MNNSETNLEKAKILLQTINDELIKPDSEAAFHIAVRARKLLADFETETSHRWVSSEGSCW